MNEETRAAVDLIRSGPFRSHAEVRAYLRELMLPEVDDETWYAEELRRIAVDAFIAKVDCAEVILATGSELVMHAANETRRQLLVAA